MLALEVWSVLWAIAGALLVCLASSYWRWFGFLFWVISNASFILLFILLGHYPMAAMQVVFLATSIIGCINNWRDKC